jgi:hypothetical protein
VWAQRGCNLQGASRFFLSRGAMCNGSRCSKSCTYCNPSGFPPAAPVTDRVKDTRSQKRARGKMPNGRYAQPSHNTKRLINTCPIRAPSLVAAARSPPPHSVHHCRQLGKNGNVFKGNNNNNATVNAFISFGNFHVTISVGNSTNQPVVTSRGQFVVQN